MSDFTDILNVGDIVDHNGKSLMYFKLVLDFSHSVSIFDEKRPYQFKTISKEEYCQLKTLLKTKGSRALKVQYV